MAARDPLHAYRGKRDFTQTTEPGDKARRRPGQGAIFVVQKHAARRLHWDFRLEHGGVLWSWAVPKGPSMDTADKRLAVHVEDHPVAYASFEGRIPAGNYGAGTVEIWDSGTWTPLGDAAADLAKGELKFRLAGKRLRGGFVLVRLKPREGERAENWLLIKEHDGEARAQGDAAALEKTELARPCARTPAPPAATRSKKPGSARWTPPRDAVAGPLPQTQAPMLASTADAPPTSGPWLSEIKFDGYRLLVRKDGAEVRVLTRNGLDWTHRLGAVARAVAALPAETLLADGELVALQPDGLSSFPDLQSALSEGRAADLHLYLFDLLYRDGFDLRACPLGARKDALRGLAPQDGLIRISDHLDGITAEIRQHACAMGVEGIICKRIDKPYRAGRSQDWLKIKCQGREEFLVLGWTPPQGSRTGLGALHLGFRDTAKRLYYAGGCGSGLSDKMLGDLSRRLAGLASEAPAKLLLTEEKLPAKLNWVRPELIAEVQYTAWSGAGRLRHPVFLGLREDKSPNEIIRDVPDPAAKRVELGKLTASHSGRVVHARKAGPRTDMFAGVPLTHPERGLWPEDGPYPAASKQDLAAYWSKIANDALPGIAHRPLAFLRCPDGIEGEHFFQKHANRGMPAALQEAECDGAPYLFLENEAGLIATAQISALELHSWGSTLDDPGHPDRLVFDLDPGEGVGMKQIAAAAHDLRSALQEEGLTCFPRTSGGKGLHLVVPLVASIDWDGARAWCRAFAERLERQKPELYVASTPKARRGGKILIDWLRNGLGSTAIASFSPRARPHATVATPLAWREVTARLDPQNFTIHTIPARLARQKSDPWAGFASLEQALPTPRARRRAHG